MDKQDSPSDSADSSSSWEFVLDSNTENAKIIKNSSAPSSRSSESDGISVLSDCEEFSRCEDVVETAEECTDDLLFSADTSESLENRNDQLTNDSFEALQIKDLNEVTTLNEHITSEETDSPIIGNCDHVNFSYLTSVSIALILALSIFLTPLNSIFLQYFHKNDTFDDGDFENDCPPVSKYCLTQYIDSEKDAGRLIIRPLDENNFKLESDVILTAAETNLNKIQFNKDNGQTKKAKSKNRKHKHSSKKGLEFEENKKNPTEDKNILDIERGQLERLNEEDYKRFITKLKKKQKKINTRAKYIKKKEKYLDVKEQHLLQIEKELYERSAKIKEFVRKEEKRRRHFNNKDDNKNKSSYFKEQSKEEKTRIKRRDVNNTFSGEWYDQLYNAREKIRKDEHASDWLFELYNYRETKRRESKKKNKSPWMGGGLNYRSNFRR